MRTRLIALAVLFAFIGSVAVAPLRAEAQPRTAAVPVDVTGVTDDGATFEGVFTITEIVSEGGVLSAVGTLTGALTAADGTPLGEVTDVPITIPLTSATGSCEILNLVLGPLDLDLLGLVVHLDQVVLNITAETGSGNLLGNLLCAVARLLDSNASGNALANLLTRILGLLG